MSLITYVGVLIIVVLAVLWGISFHFVRTGKLKVKDWFRNSLGLPQGSVRAIIAIAFISTLICSALMGKTIPKIPEWVIGLTGSIVGFYFGAATNRKDKEEEKTDNKKKKTDSNNETPDAPK